MRGRTQGELRKLLDDSAGTATTQVNKRDLALAGSLSDDRSADTEGSADNRKESLISQFTRILRESPNTLARTAIVFVGLSLFCWTWAHWGDLQVDCGREVYVPYQILRGKLLYRDLWYPYGPLEPYVSACLFKLFGEHLVVLYAFGLTLTIACALVLFEAALVLAGPAVALTTALMVVLQSFQPSYFNFIFPYSYATTTGLLFALLWLLFLIRYIHERRHYRLMVAGLAAGLALLTKQEIGLACYTATGFFVLLQFITQQSWRRSIVEAANFVPGIALAAAVYGWFFRKMSASLILYANWQYIPGSYYSQRYAKAATVLIGFRIVPIEILLLVFDAIVAVCLWRLISRLASRCAGISTLRLTLLLVIIAIAFVSFRVFAPLIMYLGLALFIYPRGMFFIGCAFFAISLYNLIRTEKNQHWMGCCILCALALPLAIRVMAQVTPAVYSIFYDPPLLMVFVIVMSKCCEEEALPTAAVRRLIPTSMFVLEVVLFAIIVVPVATKRTAKFESSWGSLYLRTDEAKVANDIYHFILDARKSGAHVLLLPELPMLYAFTDTEGPSRWYSAVPGYMSPSQELDYVAELEHKRPNFIVLTNRYNPEVDTPYFGISYDQNVYGWIVKNYKVLREFGHFERNGSAEMSALLYGREQHLVQGTSSR